MLCVERNSPEKLLYVPLFHLLDLSIRDKGHAYLAFAGWVPLGEDLSRQDSCLDGDHRGDLLANHLGLVVSVLAFWDHLDLGVLLGDHLGPQVLDRLEVLAPLLLVTLQA